MITWIVFYLVTSLLYKWLISWGGAARVEGWLSFIVIGWFALDWNAEQIKLFILIVWFFFTIIFIYGLFDSRFRDEYFLYL